MKTAVVLVTGHPASGKTTLATFLAQELRLPLVCKDEIKETLLDVLGWSTVEWSRRLSVASWSLLYQQVEALLRAGVGHVVEANFDPRYANAHWQRLAQAYSFRLVQVRCETAPEVLLARYRERIQQGERHPGHVDQSDDRAFQALVTASPPAWVALEGGRLSVDTNALDVGGYARVAAEVQAHLVEE